MSSKITPEHLCRSAVVYIRQSTLTQVLENTESQRRQPEDRALGTRHADGQSLRAGVPAR